MTDEEARVVCERVREYLEGLQGRGLDIGKSEHFEQLVNHVQAGPELADVSEDDMRVVAAMCLLGPENAGTPHATMREELLGILRLFEANLPARCERVMEFAIAYGCGKWRNPIKGYEGWEQQWEGAVRGLVRAIAPAVEESNRWLLRTVVGFPHRSRDKFWSDSWMLAMRLKHPEHIVPHEKNETLSIKCYEDGTDLKIPNHSYEKTIPHGAKAVLTVGRKLAELTLPDGETLALLGPKMSITARDDEARIEVVAEGQVFRRRLRMYETAELRASVAVELALWECACGTTHCMERHRLEGWDPAEVSLWAFGASAVKGPQPAIQTGSFAQGMYFPLLAQEGFEL